MDIPTKEFMSRLLVHKEDKEEFRNIVRQEDRNSLASSYFPYNKQITRAFLRDKHVVFIGDSLIRAMYKDMVAMLLTGDLCTTNDLRISNEDSFMGDKHIDMLELEANRVFRQGREFQSNRHLIQYFFTNRGMREDLEKTCLMMEATDERPDVVIINSAIWDISRFPPELGYTLDNTERTVLAEEISVAGEYLNRVAMILRRLKVLLSPSATVIWVIMPPSSTPENDSSGFLMLNRLKFHEIRMRLLEANVRVAQVVREAGFDVLDLSFHFRLSSFQVFRIKDGVHFNTIATRYMNQLVLGHLAAAWDMEEVVMKLWPQKLLDACIEKDERTICFETAFKTLKDFNDDKFINERIHQELRHRLFDDYQLPYPDEETDEKPALSMEKLDQNLRFLLMFMKYHDNTESMSQGHEKAFPGGVPTELNRYEEEDLEGLDGIMKECESWLGIMPALLIATNNKRPIETGRPALLPTPPPAPPGVFDNDNDVIILLDSESGSDTTTSPTSSEDSPIGVPNKIADAEPLRTQKKRGRYTVD